MKFWAKVDKTDGCWLWTGNSDGRGYGVYWHGGKRHKAHRWSYELANGVIPAGLVIDHLCRVTLCVNPSHLRAVTQRTNLMSGRTIVAEEAARTVCRNGHRLEGENVGRTPKDWRKCIPCEKARWRRNEDRRKRERTIARGEG